MALENAELRIFPQGERRSVRNGVPTSTSSRTQGVPILLEQTKGEPVYPNLKLQMWRTGLRQNRLARMLNIDETNLSRIVNGFRKPAPELKQRIAAALASDQEWLFEPGTPAATNALPSTGDLLPEEERGS